MAYFTLREAREAFERSQRTRPIWKSASQVLNEAEAKVRDADRFDIFLSHCVADADVIVGVKALLEEQGHKVYVDWLVDRQLDRNCVTPETADILRRRMQASGSLFFATSSSSPNSKWMPWELGYFDGLRQGRIAILPLVSYQGEAFKGQEYLGLYPVVERLQTSDGVDRAFVTRGQGSRTYLDIGSFRAGSSVFNTF
jgi:hypothetical protein